MFKNENGVLVEMTPEEIAEWQTSFPVVVPVEISMRNAEIVMLRAGILDDVQAIMASDMPTAEAKIDWARATTLRRDHAMLAAVGSLLGLTTEQIDALFIEGAAIGPLVAE